MMRLNNISNSKSSITLNWKECETDSILKHQTFWICNMNGCWNRSITKAHLNLWMKSNRFGFFRSFLQSFRNVNCLARVTPCQFPNSFFQSHIRQLLSLLIGVLQFQCISIHNRLIRSSLLPSRSSSFSHLLHVCFVVLFRNQYTRFNSHLNSTNKL